MTVSNVVQKTTNFNKPRPSISKAIETLTEILYLLTTGREISTHDATKMFFDITKLFSNPDPRLRRMIYLSLKELAPLAKDEIMVFGALTKDMNTQNSMYRSNAMRCLRVIAGDDASLVAALERLIKQTIVDKTPAVASASLVSAAHLFPVAPPTIKGMNMQITEAASSKHNMVQYHGLGLLYEIKKNDRLAVSKVVHTLTRGAVRSPLAHCLLIRYAAKVYQEDRSGSDRGLSEYLESCLRHKNEMVVFEAARAIVALKNVTARDITPAITVLQLFLASPKTTLKFAAVRTLNKVAMTHPLSVTSCNIDLEKLINDPNRSIATLAITTLLKTASENLVDRLVKQITSFVNEIPDESKIVVVEAIRSLCLKFPAKYRTMMNFLSSSLRDEGGFEYKNTIVNTILTLIAAIPESKEAGLGHLCEFIEDCEFTLLSTRILHLLGREGPKASNPSKYIRHIYNRVILENPTIRAAACSALAKFGLAYEPLRPSILTLLRRILYDSDDEVRDRAALYVNLLDEKNGDIEFAKTLLQDEFVIPIDNLQQSLREYQSAPSEQPFNLNSVPMTVIEPVVEEEKPVSAEAQYSQALRSIPQFANLGSLFKSTSAMELTEAELEYVVSAVNHIFPEHVVIQFNVKNTLNDQLLTNVSIELSLDEAEGFAIESVVPAPEAKFDTVAATYVCLRRDPSAFVGTFACKMKFIATEIDPTTGEADPAGGYDEEYELEDLELTTADYMLKTFVPDFRAAWENLGGENEDLQTFALASMKTVQAATSAIIDFLGMQPCEKTDAITGKGDRHILLLSGMFIGNIQVLVRARMKIDATQSVTLEMGVRSENKDVSVIIAGVIG